MSTESISEKAPRTYQSELRQRQARATRIRVIASAAELFAADGYARTTLAKIGSAAGVSAETVQAQGPKAALLISAIEYAAFGVSGEENILNLDFGRTLLDIDDFGRAVDYLVDIQTDVHERTARLALALFGGANADPELDRYLDDLMAGLNRNCERVLGVFRGRGWVRDDVPFGELAETFTVLCSVEAYLRITHRDGWDADTYRGWLRRMLTETVFVLPQPD